MVCMWPYRSVWQGESLQTAEMIDTLKISGIACPLKYKVRKITTIKCDWIWEKGALRAKRKILTFTKDKVILLTPKLNATGNEGRKYYYYYSVKIATPPFTPNGISRSDPEHYKAWAVVFLKHTVLPHGPNLQAGFRDATCMCTIIIMPSHIMLMSQYMTYPVNNAGETQQRSAIRWQHCTLCCV